MWNAWKSHADVLSVLLDMLCLLSLCMRFFHFLAIVLYFTILWMTLYLTFRLGQTQKDDRETLANLWHPDVTSLWLFTVIWSWESINSSATELSLTSIKELWDGMVYIRFKVMISLCGNEKHIFTSPPAWQGISDLLAENIQLTTLHITAPLC